MALFVLVLIQSFVHGRAIKNGFQTPTSGIKGKNKTPPTLFLLSFLSLATMSIYNERFIKEALKVAQEAYDQKEVPVGCVFVKDNQEILSYGRNKPNETCNVSANHAISSAHVLFTRPHDMLR